MISLPLAHGSRLPISRYIEVALPIELWRCPGKELKSQSGTRCLVVLSPQDCSWERGSNQFSSSSVVGCIGTFFTRNFATAAKRIQWHLEMVRRQPYRYCDFLKYEGFINQYVSETANLFDGVPLAALNPSFRGNLIALIVKEHDKKRNDGSVQFTEGEAGTRMNGTRCGWNSQLQDYCRVYPDGTKVRVEVKSEQLSLKNGCWGFEFRGVKLELFDELRLALYTPWGIEVLVWDGRTGLGTDGLVTNLRGHRILFCGPSQELNPRAAFDTILHQKMLSCHHLAHLTFDHCFVLPYLTITPKVGTLYRDTPLFTMSGACRGNLLAAIAEEHDKLHSNNSIQFVKGECGTRINGAKRGHNSSLQDYCSIYPDGTRVRVEVKSAQLTLHSHGALRFKFTNVQLQQFDELRLLMYTPWGIEILTWDGRTGLSKCGKLTEARGHDIVFVGPSKQMDSRLAADAILDRKIGDCHRVGNIAWHNQGIQTMLYSQK